MDGGVLLTRMPLAIHCHFPSATWVVHEDLGVGVYTLTPVIRTWEVNMKTKVKRAAQASSLPRTSHQQHK